MVKRRKVIKFFESCGFKNDGGTNHDIYRHPDGRSVPIGRHSEIDNVMFKEMKKQAGLERVEIFRKRRAR